MMAGQDMQPHGELLFSELGEHVRTTEFKHLTVTVSHNAGVIGVSAFLIVQEGYNEPVIVLPTLFIMSVFSGLIFTVQRRYQWWKNHYYSCMREIASSWSLPDRQKPKWLLPGHERKPSQSTDFIAYFFPLATWIASYSVFCAILIETAASKSWDLYIVIPIILVSGLIEALVAYFAGPGGRPPGRWREDRRR